MSEIHSLSITGSVICTELPKLKDVGQAKMVSFVGVSKEFIKTSDGEKSINSYFEFNAWAGAAEKIANDLMVGDTFVVLDGTPRVESWIDKETGEKRFKNIVRVNRFLIIQK